MPICTWIYMYVKDAKRTLNIVCPSRINYSGTGHHLFFTIDVKSLQMRNRDNHTPLTNIRKACERLPSQFIRCNTSHLIITCSSSITSNMGRFLTGKQKAQQAPIMHVCSRDTQKIKSRPHTFAWYCKIIRDPKLCDCETFWRCNVFEKGTNIAFEYYSRKQTQY